MKNSDGAYIQAYNAQAVVEPVFGQIMTCQNDRQLLLRGEDGARGEWRLLAACHNLRKIF
ncbi:transposase [Streptomyces stramineus]